LFEDWGSTTILLTDDLEDLGAAGSVVLSPILNLQGAGLAAKTAECFFNKVKQFRRVFSRFDQLARNYLAFVQFASVMIWLR
jgi:hypothetical protein